MNIVIADDHTIMREGLHELLENLPGVQVVGGAADGLEAVAFCKELSVDLVIMDISMPKCNGIDAAKKIKELCADVKVIMLSIHSEKSIIKEALKSGADGYLLKDCAFKEINDAVTTVFSGRVYISPTITTMLVTDFIAPQPAPAKEAGGIPLSARERLVLQGIAEGKRSKELAKELKTGVRTIERTRSTIMDKLDLYSVAELTKYAIKHGLTTLDS